MSSPKPPAAPRATLALDDLDSAPAPPVRDAQAVRSAAEASGFTSREPRRTKKPTVQKHRRPRTGRDYPFNTKIKPQCYELLSRLSYELTEEEGRVVSMAEVLERALDEFAQTREPRAHS